MVAGAARRYPAAMTDVSRLRVSDAERHAVIDRLQHATAEGRLELGELDERIADAFAARTQSDLDLLVDDLPAAAPAAPEPEDDDPLPAPPVAQVGALLAPALAALALPFSFSSAAAPALGIIAALIGTMALFVPGELPRIHRWAALIGIGAGLLPSIILVALFAIMA